MQTCVCVCVRVCVFVFFGLNSFWMIVQTQVFWNIIIFFSSFFLSILFTYSNILHLCLFIFSFFKIHRSQLYNRKFIVRLFSFVLFCFYSIICVDRFFFFFQNNLNELSECRWFGFVRKSILIKITD